MGNRIVIFGGYGNTGIKVADLVLRHIDAEVVLAARNEKKLAEAAWRLTAKHPGGNVSWVRADVSDKRLFLRTIEGGDLVVMASGTAEHASTVVSAALEAGTDCLDVQYSPQKIDLLRSMEDEIKASGRCFITDAGFHPGLPAVLVRFGAQYFDAMETARVGSVIRQNWRDLKLSPSTEREFVIELVRSQSLFFKDGEWKEASIWSTRDHVKMRFGTVFGHQLCVPLFFEELRSLPEDFPSLRHAGFYVAGFNWKVEFLVFPLVMGVLKLFPIKGVSPMGRLMTRSLSTTSKPPFGCVLKLEATGLVDGGGKKVEIFLYHDDGYWFTAIPVVACLFQYLDGTARKPGLWTMGDLVNPHRLMSDMMNMGIRRWMTDNDE